MSFLALAIGKETKQMPHMGTMSAQVFDGVDKTKSIEEYKSLDFRTGTDTVVQDVIAMFIYRCTDTIQVTIQMLKG
jgi:hypothetical protein